MVSAANTKVTGVADSIACVGIRELVELTGFSRATIFRRMAERDFPQPLSRRPLRWRVGAVARWMDEREADEAEKTRRIERLAEV